MREFEFEFEYMHDGNRAGAAAASKLTRSRMGGCVSPFEAGVALVHKAQSMAVHFSYGTRHDELLSTAKTLGAAEIKLEVYHNSTRIAAEHGLLFSALGMNRLPQGLSPPEARVA